MEVLSTLHKVDSLKCNMEVLSTLRKADPLECGMEVLSTLHKANSLECKAGVLSAGQTTTIAHGGRTWLMLAGGGARRGRRRHYPIRRRTAAIQHTTHTPAHSLQHTANSLVHKAARWCARRGGQAQSTGGGLAGAGATRGCEWVRGICKHSRMTRTRTRRMHTAQSLVRNTNSLGTRRGR
jgi:hypothetical protein